MNSYKGIDLARCPKIKNYIDTYHILDRDNYKSYLEDDIPLQKLVRNYYIKKSITITLFNLTPYAIILSLYLIKG